LSFGGATLSAAGSSWIPLASAPGFVRGVGYAGGGAVGATLTVTIGNAKAGLWYAVYASRTVNGEYAFVQRAQAAADGTLPFTIDASDTTKFIRIKASDSEIDPADPLFPSPRP